MRNSPHEELLLLLLRPAGDPRVSTRIEALVAAGPDWAALLKIAAAEQLGPLLHHRVQGASGVPPAVARTLKEAYLRSDALTLRSSGDLAQLLESLLRAGLTAVCLKGPVLAEELLGDAALLPAVDLDLLVRREEIPEVSRCLALLDYRPAQPSAASSLVTLTEVEFLGGPGRVPVECHHRLGHGRHFPIPAGHWWSALREVEFRGGTVRVLARDRSVLFAALHLFKHGFGSLKHLVGFAAMLRAWRDAVDWEALFEDASRFRADKALLLSAALASALFEPPLPAAVVRRLERLSPRERRLVDATVRDLFRRRRSPAGLRVRVLFLQHGTLGGMRLLSRWAVPPVEEVRLRYQLRPGSKRVWAYYLLNPLLMYRRRHL